MKPYIFTERNGIHIIDLQKTVKSLETSYALVRDSVTAGGTLLFVGTKRQAQETIQSEAIRAGMPYVTNRWLGGMLTNWRTIRMRINELDRMERMRDKGEFERLTKKEGLLLSREIERLEILFSGIRQMTRLPDLLFVVDVRREATSIHEANLLKIPVIALVDTNCDPRDVDYVIPSNDDAIRAIKLLVGKIADACLEGKAMRKDLPEEPEMVEMTMTGIEERELTDEELLGESTLAKLSYKGRVVEFEDEVEIVGEETESIVDVFETDQEEIEEELAEIAGDELAEIAGDELVEIADDELVDDEADEESDEG
jgi:small subunit ribosomal protein S2